jgi:hypothetical protein
MAEERSKHNKGGWTRIRDQLRRIEPRRIRPTVAVMAVVIEMIMRLTGHWR